MFVKTKEGIKVASSVHKLIKTEGGSWGDLRDGDEYIEESSLGERQVLKILDKSDSLLDLADCVVTFHPEYPKGYQYVVIDLDLGDNREQTAKLFDDYDIAYLGTYTENGIIYFAKKEGENLRLLLYKYPDPDHTDCPDLAQKLGGLEGVEEEK